jgi:hypothetical protein
MEKICRQPVFLMELRKLLLLLKRDMYEKVWGVVTVRNDNLINRHFHILGILLLKCEHTEI